MILQLLIAGSSQIKFNHTVPRITFLLMIPNPSKSRKDQAFSNYNQITTRTWRKVRLRKQLQDLMSSQILVLLMYL